MCMCACMSMYVYVCVCVCICVLCGVAVCNALQAIITVVGMAALG